MKYSRMTEKHHCIFAVDNKFVGIIAVADTIKETSRQAIEDMRNMGLDVIMLTGDNAVTANAIKKQAAVKQCRCGGVAVRQGRSSKKTSAERSQGCNGR